MGKQKPTRFEDLTPDEIETVLEHRKKRIEAETRDNAYKKKLAQWKKDILALNEESTLCIECGSLNSEHTTCNGNYTVDHDWNLIEDDGDPIEVKCEKCGEDMGPPRLRGDLIDELNEYGLLTEQERKDYGYEHERR